MTTATRQTRSEVLRAALPAAQQEQPERPPLSELCQVAVQAATTR
jgi:hypothetical protein